MIVKVRFTEVEQTLPTVFTGTTQHLTGKFINTTQHLPAAFTDTAQQLFGKFGEIQTVTLGGDVYLGEYEVTPKVTEQTLPTAKKLLTKDVTILEIPYFEVSNSFGGGTVYIASSIYGDTDARLGTARLGKMRLSNGI